jgi:hypothetical protein
VSSSAVGGVGEVSPGIENGREPNEGVPPSVRRAESTKSAVVAPGPLKFCPGVGWMNANT